VKNRLIILEGLPGSGKTTVSELITSNLNNSGFDTVRFTESDLDNPADYNGVSFFYPEEFYKLKCKFSKHPYTFTLTIPQRKIYI